MRLNFLTLRLRIYRRLLARALTMTLASFALMPLTLHAGGGPFGIDSIIEKDESGIFKRSTQWNVLYAMAATSVGGALWYGTDTRLGKTFAQSSDALVLGMAGSYAVKNIFTRARPRDGNDPDLWFQGGTNESFVSGEVTVVTAMVTPLILEYRKEQPAVYLLTLLPIYDAVARMKSQAHWQSDVISAAVLGASLGYYAHQRESSLLFRPQKDGLMVSWGARW